MSEFANIVLSAGKSKKRGSVGLSGSGDTARFTFTANKTPKPVDIGLGDVEWLRWMESGRGIAEGAFVVKMGLKGNSYVKMHGFPASAYNALSSWLSGCGKELLVEKVSTRGANWGMLKVDDHRLAFEDKEGLSVFDVPLNALTQATVQKHEIALEFPQDDDTKSLQGQMETLCEIRLFVPNDERLAQLEAEALAREEQKEKERAERLERGEEEFKEGDDEEEDIDDDSAAQVLVKDIMNRLGGDEKAVQPIARFNLMFQSPRGKYDVDLYPSYLRLHNKTFQHKLLFKYIQKMFLFDSPTTNQHYFVIGLNPPVRQGRTAYHFMLVQFDNADYMEENFNIDEKTCQDQYKGIMQPSMKGASYDVVTRVFKALTERKVLVPGQEYASRAGGANIRCSWKANDGQLFIMQKSFFFVKKPLMHIRYNEVVELSFERLSNSSTGSKSFDLRVVTNEEKNNEYVFAGIARDEYQTLFDYLKSKRLNITSQFEAAMTSSASGRMRVATNYDESVDPHLNRITDERAGGGDDDDDSDEDSDFEGGSSSSESSGMGSEGESDMSDGSAAPAPAPKKKSRKKADSEDEGETKKGKKRKRAAPAKSAYYCYLQEQRPIFLEANPELRSSMVDVTRGLAKQWSEVSAEDREKYQRMADEENARTAAERAEAGSDDEDSGRKKKGGKKRSSKKSSGEPKRAPTAQRLFSDKRKGELKSEQLDLTTKEINDRVSEEWKKMSEEEQQPWVEKHLTLKKEYKRLKAEWDAKQKDLPEGDEDGGASGTDGEKRKKKDKKKKKKDKKSKKKKRKDKKREEAESDQSDADMEDVPAVKEEPTPMEE